MWNILNIDVTYIVCAVEHLNWLVQILEVEHWLVWNWVEGGGGKEKKEEEKNSETKYYEQR